MARMSDETRRARRGARYQTVHVPVTPEEHETLRGAAQRVGSPLAVWLRALGLNAARGQHRPPQRKRAKKAPRKGREEG